MSHHESGGAFYDIDDPYFDSEVTQNFTCDVPGCISEYAGEGDFIEVFNRAKHRGWRAVKVGRYWKHTCPQHAGTPMTPGTVKGEFD